MLPGSLRVSPCLSVSLCVSPCLSASGTRPLWAPLQGRVLHLMQRVRGFATDVKRIHRGLPGDLPEDPPEEPRIGFHFPYKCFFTHIGPWGARFELFRVGNWPQMAAKRYKIAFLDTNTTRNCNRLQYEKII